MCVCLFVLKQENVYATETPWKLNDKLKREKDIETLIITVDDSNTTVCLSNAEMFFIFIFKTVFSFRFWPTNPFPNI